MRKLAIHNKLWFFVFAIIIALLCTYSARVFALEEKALSYSKNAIYFEGFGQGLLYSINYDYRLRQNLGVRFGISHWSLSPVFLAMTGNINFTAFPIMLNRFFGKGKHLLELGVGVMPAELKVDKVTDFFGKEYNKTTDILLGTATIGYRYQPLIKGWLFRVGLTPFFTLDTLTTSFGISLGYAF